VGVNYRFASTEDREKFKADPDKHLPQYGGYCAYAMSIDRIAGHRPISMGDRKQQAISKQ
jgi:hypothetical protein